MAPESEMQGLRVVGATKTFGSVTALDGVSFEVGRGEIVALLGDNGAGKSTMIKAISGVHTLDGGEIWLDGERIRFKSPREARNYGVETVYQDLALFDNLGVTENFFSGRELAEPPYLGPLARVKRRAMRRRAEETLEELQVHIKDIDAPVGFMSGGQRQAIAVARAVAFANNLVILDEPTAALGMRESQRVVELIRLLPARGISVILISHNLTEVAALADRAIVLRRGRLIGEAQTSPDQHNRIVGMIVGSGAQADF